MELLSDLLTWEGIWRLSLLVLIIGFANGIGMGIASMIIPFRSKKEISYDNLDKPNTRERK